VHRAVKSRRGTGAKGVWRKEAKLNFEFFYFLKFVRSRLCRSVASVALYLSVCLSVWSVCNVVYCGYWYTVRPRAKVTIDRLIACRKSHWYQNEWPWSLSTIEWHSPLNRPISETVRDRGFWFPPIGNGLLGIKCSRNRWRHVNRKGYKLVTQIYTLTAQCRKQLEMLFS